MNISGSMRIFRKDYEGSIFYSTTLSKKDEFGNYENLYINVQLPKDIALDNNTKINVTKGFLSFYKTKQGLSKIKAVVQEFEREETTTQGTSTINYEQQAIDYFDNPTNYYGDLPF